MGIIGFAFPPQTLSAGRCDNTVLPGASRCTPSIQAHQSLNASLNVGLKLWRTLTVPMAHSRSQPLQAGHDLGPRAACPLSWWESPPPTDPAKRVLWTGLWAHSRQTTCSSPSLHLGHEDLWLRPPSGTSPTAQSFCRAYL